MKRDEQETIINFNKAEDVAYVFTYERTWQEHIEKRFNVKPIYDNGKGGKEYVIPKSRISKPRAFKQNTRKLSPEHLAKMQAGRRK